MAGTTQALVRRWSIALVIWIAVVGGVDLYLSLQPTRYMATVETYAYPSATQTTAERMVQLNDLTYRPVLSNLAAEAESTPALTAAAAVFHVAAPALTGYQVVAKTRPGTHVLILWITGPSRSTVTRAAGAVVQTVTGVARADTQTVIVALGPVSLQRLDTESHRNVVRLGAFGIEIGLAAMLLGLWRRRDDSL